MKVFVVKKGTTFTKVTRKSIEFEINGIPLTLFLKDVDFIIPKAKEVLYFPNQKYIDFIRFSHGNLG